jgi:hypothetical protein
MLRIIPPHTIKPIQTAQTAISITNTPKSSSKIIATQVTLARAAKPHHNFFAFPAWESTSPINHIPISENTTFDHHPCLSPSSPLLLWLLEKNKYKDGRRRKSSNGDSKTG